MSTETIPWTEAVGRHLADNSFVTDAWTRARDGARFIKSYDLVEGWRVTRVHGDTIEVVAEEEMVLVVDRSDRRSWCPTCGRDCPCETTR